MKAINQTFFHPCEFSDMAGKSMEFDNDHENDTEITCVVYPNPTEGIINFEFSTPVECGFIELYNINGQIVSVFEFLSKSSQLQIDVSHCKSGVYMYKVITGNHFYSGRVSVIKN